MVYRRMVKRVQDYSGFSEQEAETALRLVTEIIASKLEAGERKDFASQLPLELKVIALSVNRTTSGVDPEDIYIELSQLQDIDITRAKKQVIAVWETLEDSLSEGQMEHVRSHLSEELVEELY